MPQRIGPGDSVAARYRELADEGVIKPDPAQQALAQRLDRLNAEVASQRLAAKSSSLGWLFAKTAPKRGTVRGLYIQGSVGRGKTMLMDFFFRACPAHRKRRVHFHAFMADVHDRIAAHRALVKQGLTRQTDPIPPVAQAIADEAWVLCFDEFSVTDIADAMILSRLFTALFAQGVVLVATSNVLPGDLYRDGLNRSLFLPFIDVLNAHADTVSLDADRDYRLGRTGPMPHYVTPLGAATDKAMGAIWADLTGSSAGGEATIAVKGRTIKVPAAGNGCARFAFSDLCEQPLGARDYLAIAEAYHTLMLDGVPVLGPARRNEAKRFITLIDTLYDTHRVLIMSAAAEPDDLYQARTGTEAFEFARTASRLTEMRSKDWVAGKAH